MSTNYERVRDSRHKRKDDILYVMGDKCCLCGYCKAKTALELHHLDPSEKDFTIGACLNRSWDTLHKEIQKCILVCSNCHREIHEGLLDQELQSSYNSARGEEITQKNQEIRKGKKHYCFNCGKVISSKAKFCVDCSYLERQTVERPSREELKKLIREKTFVEIGRMYQVSDNAIRKWCKSVNLPTKKTEIKGFSDEEWSEI